MKNLLLFTCALSVILASGCDRRERRIEDDEVPPNSMQTPRNGNNNERSRLQNQNRLQNSYVPPSANRTIQDQ